MKQQSTYLFLSLFLCFRSCKASPVVFCVRICRRRGTEVERVPGSRFRRRWWNRDIFVNLTLLPSFLSIQMGSRVSVCYKSLRRGDFDIPFSSPPLRMRQTPRAGRHQLLQLHRRLLHLVVWILHPHHQAKRSSFSFSIGTAYTIS